jgi:hypothetical protein
MYYQCGVVYLSVEIHSDCYGVPEEEMPHFSLKRGPTLFSHQQTSMCFDYCSLKMAMRPGIVVPLCNPSYLGGVGGSGVQDQSWSR